jgi:hypothetical protein
MQEVIRIPLWVLFSGFAFGVSERMFIALVQPTVGNLALMFCAAFFLALATVAIVGVKLGHSVKGE